MDDQEFKKRREAAQEQVINSYEVTYMVEMLLAASYTEHLTAAGIMIGLLRVAAHSIRAGDSEENRNSFMLAAEKVSWLDSEELCGCSDCIMARATARKRVRESWGVVIPDEFPTTVGSA